MDDLLSLANYSEGLIGGEIGIRTLGTLTGTPHFECGAFDHSAISPHVSQAMVALPKQHACAKERRD
jgi:hypothetical protein